MGSTLEWLNTKKITPAQMIWILIGIFLFILFETPYFKDEALIRAAIYICIVGISVLLGFKFVDVRQFARKIKDIVLDPNLDQWQKISAMINLVIPILTEIGESFDVFYGEQFPPSDQTITAQPDTAIDPETGQRYTIEKDEEKST